MSDKKATLTIEGKDAIDLPIYSGSIGPDVVDVGALTAQGMFTYDPGFTSTASCTSAITYIDGGAGQARTEVATAEQQQAVAAYTQAALSAFSMWRSSSIKRIAKGINWWSSCLR